MKDWQIRHRIFHSVFKLMDMGDDLSKEIIIEENDKDSIVERAIQYPTIQTKELYYPGKSYAVGIIFAKLLEIHFQEKFYDSLDSEDLLFENDPYFVPYSADKNTYDDIIQSFPFELLENPKNGTDNFQKTCEYFMKEFLLHDETKMLLPT